MFMYCVELMSWELVAHPGREDYSSFLATIINNEPLIVNSKLLATNYQLPTTNY